MEYNLVRNAQLNYLIDDDSIYDRVLSADELSYINDNDISFENSILVSGTEYLTFEAIFNRRIKINKVKLYLYSTTTSGTTLDHLNFYYSNDNELDYEIVTDKFVGDDNFYYAELPFPSAPMKVKVTVSGLDCSISEYFISNDDYPIGFGKNGDLGKLYITRTDDNNRTAVQQLAIYNRNTNSLNDLVSAYVCIDYTGEDGDKYLKISDKADSDFIGVDDSILIEDNLLNNTYIWDMGVFNRTKVTNNELVLNFDNQSYSSIFIKGNVPHPEVSGPFLEWSYNVFVADEINKVIYVAVPDYHLTFYKYFYTDDTWEFIGKIDYKCVEEEDDYSIAKIDNYIYASAKSNCDFGRYDLNVSESNFELLETPPTYLPIIGGDASCICGDGNEYIYFISGSREGPVGIAPEYSSFVRYSTISGSVAGWEPLANDFSVSLTSNVNPKIILEYNKEEDCLYFMNGYYTLEYIQRYDVLTNTWDTTWFHIQYYMYSTYNFSFSYRYPFIYIINSDYIYSYNTRSYVFTEIIKWGDGGNYYHAEQRANIIGVEPEILNEPQQIIFTGASEDYYGQDNMYIYNNTQSFYGEYTTPVLDIIDGYKSSYFLIDYELQQGTSVTNDKFNTTNLMKLRSSDTSVLPIERIYFSNDSGMDCRIKSVNLYTGSLTDIVPTWNNYIYHEILAWDINNVTGDLCVSYIYSGRNWITVYDYVGLTIKEIDDDIGDEYRISLSTMKFDSEGGIYGYNAIKGLFTHFDSSLNVIERKVMEEHEIVKELCAGDDLTAWYIHEETNELIHCDEYFQQLYSMVLNEPCLLEPDGEGGVWVLHNDQMEIIKYDKFYNIKLIILFNELVTKMSPDKDGGLWVTQSLLLKYINKDNTIVEIFTLPNAPTWMVTGYKSCFLYNNTLRTGYFFRYPDGLVKEDIYSYSLYISPLFFCHTNEDAIIGKKNYLPISYDPNWGTDGIIEWEDVQVNGYYLPKNKYHQLKITLKATNFDQTPKIKKIKMATSIKLVDIQKNTYKSIYLKLDVPNQFKNHTYNTKIKCWWEDKE